MRELREGAVALRPLRRDDYDAVWRSWGVGAAGVRPPRARERLLERIERSPELVDGRLDLAVEEDGRLVGTVEARQPTGGLPRGTFEVGIGLFEEADRSRGVGTAAVRLLTAYLFDELEAERVQASTWVENTGMRRVLEKLGFAEEGVMRAFMPNDRGGRDDYVLYAMTRADRSRV